MKIELEARDFPKFKLSTNQDLILFLIKNELLSTRFLNQLESIGFDTSSFGIDLSIVILSLMGFENRTDSFWEWYYTNLEAYVFKINTPDYEVVNSTAFDFYIVLKTKLKEEQKKG
ncbi:hypothetical protein [Aquimarina muelleri]|uniref:Uncharacterized protein n=1 Tax=Aquimarina muelleri TaxID=279356 RepID=A0A918JX30_9FLAO|nr:hypothetical protein [Aquimarina muelleri]MCX2763775.1 hypothetical protein [Aquimarina muelleri]GGX29567.1 hypothetical protein GCM10007384_33390 [Aquimarina muelleri]